VTSVSAGQCRGKQRKVRVGKACKIGAGKDLQTAQGKTLLKQMEESRVILSSMFLWQTPYYTLKQIPLLKEWTSGKLLRHIDLRTYLYTHWHDLDEEGA